MQKERKKANETTMPAFSSSSSSSPASSFGDERLQLSSTTKTTNHQLLKQDDSENLLFPPKFNNNLFCYSPRSVKKRAPIVSLNEKCPRKRLPVRRPTMDAAYPGHLMPHDHPIFNQDFFKPKTSSHTPIALRSFTTEFPAPIAEPVVRSTTLDSNANNNERGEKRRSKRFNQPAARYRTTPVTLEEIREIDEELYAKQQPAKKEQDDDPINSPSSINGKRNSPYASCSATFTSFHSPKRSSSLVDNASSDFKCTFMTKTRLLPGRALWPNNHPGYNNHRHRSQDNLVHLGLSPLPTIPEEWRQQHQQQKSNAAAANSSNNNVETISATTPVSIDARSPEQNFETGAQAVNGTIEEEQTDEIGPPVNVV